MSTLAYAVRRLGHDAAPQPQAHAALPVGDAAGRRPYRWSSCCCSSTSFGGTLGAGLGGATGGRAAYVELRRPGILLIAVAGAAQGTAISVAMDMTEGIIARFRTMAISRPSVLTGHVLGSVIQTMLGLAVVVGVALAIGFRPNAGAGRVGRGGRRPRDDHVRGHLAVGRAGPGGQERGGREQPRRCR